jgi:hypothetical protein
LKKANKALVLEWFVVQPPLAPPPFVQPMPVGLRPVSWSPAQGLHAAPSPVHLQPVRRMHVAGRPASGQPVFWMPTVQPVALMMPAPVPREV